MLKYVAVAGALSLGLVIACPMGAAHADTNVSIGIGRGGVYDSGPHYWPARRGISCGEGRRIVASTGFRRVSVLDCHGREYTYRGIRRDGMYRITLRSSNGRIEDVDRIRRWGGGYDDDDYDDRPYGGDYDDYDDEY
jgi:hypothetical protein